MSDLRVGAAFRAVRLRRNWRQADLARAADVSVGLVSALERGHLGTATISTLRKVGAALEIDIDVRARWRGGELDRVVNARHNELGRLVAAHLTGLGWVVHPEVSFAYYGERGVVDLLAWHAATETLLVIEIKTEIVDPQELIGTLDRKTRLARRIADDRGLRPRAIATWLVVAEGSTNRKRVARFAPLLRSALPADGRAVAAWLASPRGSIAGISFFSNLNHGEGKQPLAGRTRVRRKKSAVAERGARQIKQLARS
jgi:transcriptional regulator with XRE-family HTH domain